MVSDFAVFLTIVLMVLIDFVVGVPSQKLQVPSKFKVNKKPNKNWPKQEPVELIGQLLLIRKVT